MSLSPESRSETAGAAIHVNHYCCTEGCRRWGGFGWFRTRGEPVQWWCAKHYPMWEGTAKSRYEAMEA